MKRIDFSANDVHRGYIGLIENDSMRQMSKLIVSHLETSTMCIAIHR